MALLETCEVLLNLDSDGIARLMAADKFEKNLKHLNQIFGDTEWPSEIAGQRSSMQQLCAAVLMAYKRSLRALASPLCVRLWLTMASETQMKSGGDMFYCATGMNQDS